MFDGVLAGPGGRCGLRSCSDSESASRGGTFSKVAVAPRLEPRGRVVVVFVHGGTLVEWERGGEEEMEEGRG